MKPPELNTDVIIVGSGISGLVLSNLLKEKKIDHLVLNRLEKQKKLELPETIPPSALVLLESLNLLEPFSKSSSKTFGYHSVWNSDQLTTNNFFDHNPFKYGLKLNKKKLLEDLRELVSEHVLSYDNLTEFDSTDESVCVKMVSENSVRTIRSKLIIDATGRNRSILKQLGVASESFDKQVSLSCHLPYFKHPKLIHPVYTESFEHGWGIVSSLNEQTNGMTLYTKIGSPILADLKVFQNWKSILSGTTFLKDFLTDDADRKIVGGEANSTKASQITGSNWLAIGDAAIAFDPISSHGVTNAIYCANSAAQAIEAQLATQSPIPLQNYAETLHTIFDEYFEQKANLYGI
jgi:flavin-dependent dehydrogenase